MTASTADVSRPTSFVPSADEQPSAAPLDHYDQPNRVARAEMLSAGVVVPIAPAPLKVAPTSTEEPAGGCTLVDRAQPIAQAISVPAPAGLVDTFVPEPTIIGSLPARQSSAGDPVAPVPPIEGSATMRPPGAGCISSGQEPPFDPEAIPRPAPDPKPFVELRFFAEAFHDLQQNREALAGRVRAAKKTGYVLVDPLLPVLELAKKNEDASKLALKRCLRRVAPELRSWALVTTGIGEHSLGLLLGAAGHPLWAYPHRWEGSGTDRVLIAGVPYTRSLSQFRSYCGHGDAARRPTKGMTAGEAAALGNPRAKRATWLMATGALKAGIRKLDDSNEFSPQGREATTELGDVYYQRRCQTWDREWSKGHKHADAVRVLGKHILREVWLTAHASEQLFDLDQEPAA